VLSTWRHNYSFLGTPLVDPDVVDDAISMMVESFSDLAPGLISLDWVGAGGVVLPSLERRLASAGLPWRPHAAHVRATIERTSVADGVPRQLSASRRKSLRRRRRRLAESAGGELALRVDDDDASVERFLAMEASGWKGRTGTAMAARAADAEFFRATCREFAARGRLQILTLGTAQTDVAMQCNVTAGDVVFCFKVAYAEAFAADSPGVQLELDAVDHYLRERTDVAWMDSCAEPDNDLINALWPDRRAIETVVIATGGAVDRTLVRSLPALSAARRRVSQIMQERGRRPASERDPQDAAPSA
jgi:hypothetical protein